MQIIPEEISTRRPSMSVIHCEEGAGGPVIDLLETGLCDVQDDAHSVFVVVSEYALIRISRIRSYEPILFLGVPRLVEIRKNDVLRVQAVPLIAVQEALNDDVHRLFCCHGDWEIFELLLSYISA